MRKIGLQSASVVFDDSNITYSGLLNITLFEEEEEEEYDATGAAYYVVAVVLVYGLSMVLLIGSLAKRKMADKDTEWENQIHQYLHKVPDLREKNARDAYKQLKNNVIRMVSVKGMHSPTASERKETDSATEKTPEDEEAGRCLLDESLGEAEFRSAAPAASAAEGATRQGVGSSRSRPHPMEHTGREPRSARKRPPSADELWQYRSGERRHVVNKPTDSKGGAGGRLTAPPEPSGSGSPIIYPGKSSVFHTKQIPSQRSPNMPRALGPSGPPSRSPSFNRSLIPVVDLTREENQPTYQARTVSDHLPRVHQPQPSLRRSPILKRTRPENLILNVPQPRSDHSKSPSLFPDRRFDVGVPKQPSPRRSPVDSAEPRGPVSLSPFIVSSQASPRRSPVEAQPQSTLQPPGFSTGQRTPAKQSPQPRTPGVHPTTSAATGYNRSIPIPSSNAEGRVFLFPPRNDIYSQDGRDGGAIAGVPGPAVFQRQPSPSSPARRSPKTQHPGELVRQAPQRPTRLLEIPQHPAQRQSSPASNGSVVRRPPELPPRSVSPGRQKSKFNPLLMEYYLAEAPGEPVKVSAV